MAERVGPFIARRSGVRRVPNPNAIEDDQQRAHFQLQSDRVPSGFHLDRIENPIGIFRLGLSPIGWLELTRNISFHVEPAAPLQLASDFRIAARIYDRIYIHMTGEVRREFRAISG